jgi:hypothetical protein
MMRSVLFILSSFFAGTAFSFSCIDRSYDKDCDLSHEKKNEYLKYFSAMKPIYGDYYSDTVLNQQRKCGWPQSPNRNPDLPLYVLSVGLEGAGHHLYSQLFKNPVVDCVWVNNYGCSFLDALSLLLSLLFFIVVLCVIAVADKRSTLQSGNSRWCPAELPRTAEEWAGRAIGAQEKSWSGAVWVR